MNAARACIATAVSVEAPTRHDFSQLPYMEAVMMQLVCCACEKALDVNAAVRHSRTHVPCHPECVNAPVRIRIDNEREAYKAIERILQHLGIHD